MRFFTAGSFVWLLLHEIRIAIRGSFRANRLGIAITVSFIVILTVFAGIPLAVALSHFRLVTSGAVILAIDMAILVFFTLLLSQTLSSATLALYERGDLDLVLSSPVPAHRVLAVRGLVIAVQPLSIFLSLMGPLLVPLAFFGHAAWLGAIAVLMSLALAAASVGLLLAMSLFALIGPKRTRTLGQLLAAFIGAALFLAGQARYVFSYRFPAFGNAFTHLASSPWFAPDGLLAFPARAVLGQTIPLATISLASVVLFTASVRSLGARFSTDASVAAGAGNSSRRSASTKRRPFRAGPFRCVIRKELLLLIRDPALLSQVFLRILYLLPLAFILLRNARAHVEGQIATGSGALVFITSQLAASLAWIAISAEDSPELLASAPVTKSFIDRAKLTAALLPLAVLLVIPLLALLLLSPRVGIVTALGVTAAALSAGLINLWFEVPGQRRHLRRRGSGSLVGNLAVLVIGLAWSATTTGAAARSLWSLAGIAATLLLLLGFYRARIVKAV